MPQERPYVTKRGLTFDRKRSKKAKERIAWYAIEYKTTNELKPFKGDLGLKVVCYGTKQNADASNYLKLVEDALEGVLYENDSQIVDTQCVKRSCLPNEAPRTEIMLSVY